MAYRLSDRNLKDSDHTIYDDPDKVHLGKIATVFIVFSLLSFLTAWIYSSETENVAKVNFKSNNSANKVKSIKGEVGPINVVKYRETYNIAVKANLVEQSWSNVEGQVLDSNKKYLFSFGKELSLYSGYDSEGSWTERNDNYDINVTFPKPGTYYLQFLTESDRYKTPYQLQVKVSKKRGSSIPHMWFGIITLIIGIILNEIRNRTISRIFENFD